jgi:nucleotide-binding universal stress UspA family protein
MDAGTNIHASGEIVVGIDTSSSGRSALKWAAEYARSTGQRLHAVHVFNYNPAAPMAWAPGGPPAMSYRSANELRDGAEREIRAEFESVAPEPGWRLESCAGPVGQTLVHKAEQAQLLVIGTREHTGIDRVLTGSVSHYCLTRVQCPLVAVPPTPSKAGAGTPTEIGESANDLGGEDQPDRDRSAGGRSEESSHARHV